MVSAQRTFANAADRPVERRGMATAAAPLHLPQQSAQPIQPTRVTARC